MKRTVALTELDDATLLRAPRRERGTDLSVSGETFLHEVPPPELRATLERTIDELGTFQRVEPGGADHRYVLVATTHELRLELVRDATGRIMHLPITDRVVRHPDLAETLGALDAASMSGLVV